MDISVSIVLALVSVAVSLLIFRYGIMRDSFKDQALILQRLTAVEMLGTKCKECKANEMQADIAAIKEQNRTFWTILAPVMAAAVHQDIAPRRDELVEKLTSFTISVAEIDELKPLLIEQMNNGAKEKRIPFTFLLAMAEIERIEKARAQ